LEEKHIPVGLFLILVGKTELAKIGALIYLKKRVTDAKLKAKNS